MSPPSLLQLFNRWLKRVVAALAKERQAHVGNDKEAPLEYKYDFAPLLSPALKKANPLVPEKKGVVQAALHCGSFEMDALNGGIFD